jgi:3-methyladenine DNA glycosylase AlkD
MIMTTTAAEILKELKSLGGASYKKLLMSNYGVKEPLYGVKIGDLNTIRKRIKMDYQLALDLYDTGNYDAMYLAGLIADDARMSKKDLRGWVAKAYAGSLPGTTVASVAAGSPHGLELALEWIDSPRSHVAAAGWATLSCLVAVKPDAELDQGLLKRLLQRVRKTILPSPDAVRYHMNAFLIAVGSYVKSLTQPAIRIGEQLGPLTCNLGNNQCQVFFAPDYIRKVEKAGRIGRKRKTVKC